MAIMRVHSFMYSGSDLNTGSSLKDDVTDLASATQL